MTDTDLVKNVRDELSWDPKIDSSTVAVSAHNGTVTLRGTTHTLREKIEANRAAKRVRGVLSVVDYLQPRILHARTDNELRGAVLQAFALDSVVPSTVDARVTDGLVELTGSVEWQFQRDEAERVASNVPGVTGIADNLELTLPSPPPADLKDAIRRALVRNARLDADELSVESSAGTVTISGKVSSWAEHDEAIDAVWAAPGVRDVRDEVVVAS